MASISNNVFTSGGLSNSQTSGDKQGIISCPTALSGPTDDKLVSKVSKLLESPNRSNFIFRVKKSCITTPLLGKYVPSKYISSGSYGVVYLVCEDNDKSKCRYVVKVMHPFMMMKEKDILREMKMSAEMGRSYGNLPPVGPNVISTFCCEGEVNYGDDEWISTMLYFIVMEKMDITYNEYVNRYLAMCRSKCDPDDQKAIDDCNKQVENIMDKIQGYVNSLVENIEKRGYRYADFHLNNIMFNIEGFDIKDIKIIDFGILKPVEKLPITKTIGRFTVEDDE